MCPRTNPNANLPLPLLVPNPHLTLTNPDPTRTNTDPWTYTSVRGHIVLTPIKPPYRKTYSFFLKGGFHVRKQEKKEEFLQRTNNASTVKPG